MTELASPPEGTIATQPASVETRQADSMTVNPHLPLAPAINDVPDLSPVYDVPVRVQAILGRARMPVERLIALGAGDVIELDRKVGEPVDIMVNNRLIARGEIVMIENRLGVTLTEIIREN